ncbi:MAG TPA: hypothetical protein VMC08_03350 [Bacteroidales bacterium]|nr:hypothetical protein [Bacteroidales bacterium]
MEPLEKYVTENRHLFDDAEPDPGHFKRFEARLAREERKSYLRSSRPVMMRIAASLVLLLALSFVLTYVARQNFFGLFPQKQSASGLSAEVRDALSYYDGRVQDRMIEIRNMEKSCPGAKNLSARAQNQLNALNLETDDLKNTLKNNPDNEKVIAALIRNQQMKETILDNMISKGCNNNH